MSSKALVKNETHLLEREDPRTGFIERVPFLGSLRHKPKGWRLAGTDGRGKNQVHLIERKDPRTGYTTRVQYEGPLRLKPKGWRVVDARR